MPKQILSWKKLFIGLFVVIIAAVVLIWILPMAEIASAVAFRWFPDHAKVSHLIRMTTPIAEKEILILGTVHYQHVETDRYPLMELKSVIEASETDLLLVEILPEAAEDQ
ncbi:MAG: hypothetical protein HN348_30110, partial [Proteobacteria bacterium]|nr:hypothetical protein [Pseudomonadota bacterium]